MQIRTDIDFFNKKRILKYKHNAKVIKSMICD